MFSRTWVNAVAVVYPVGVRRVARGPPTAAPRTIHSRGQELARCWQRRPARSPRPRSRVDSCRGKRRCPRRSRAAHRERRARRSPSRARGCGGAGSPSRRRSCRADRTPSCRGPVPAAGSALSTGAKKSSLTHRTDPPSARLARSRSVRFIVLESGLSSVAASGADACGRRVEPGAGRSSRPATMSSHQLGPRSQTGCGPAPVSSAPDTGVTGCRCRIRLSASR